MLDAQLFPGERRLLVNGRYDLRNDTDAPIRDVHVRRGDRDVEWLKLDLAGATLVEDDAEFGYRIYRFDHPAGARRHAPRSPSPRASGTAVSAPATPATDVIENGTFANNIGVRPGYRHEPPGPAQRPHPAPPPGAAAPNYARPSSRTLPQRRATISAPTG